MKLLTSLLMAFTVYAQPVVKTKLPEASKELKKLAKEFHRVGNGGHPFEKEWRMLELEVLNANANAVSQGQQAADTKTIQDTIDRTYIFVTDDVFVTAPSGLLVEKAAKNFIQNNFWHIQISARIWPTLTKSQKMDLIYHELLGLNGLESNNYDVSAIVNLAPAHFTPAPNMPITLYEQAFDQSKSGMSYAQADKLCRAYQEMLEDKYFFIYCQFHKKNWSVVKHGYVMVNDYRYLGQMYGRKTYEAFAGAGINAGFALLRSKSYVYSNHVYSKPLIKRIRVPKNVTYTQEKSIYGLKIIAEGITALTPSHVLFTSEEEDYTHSATKREAKLKCRKYLVHFEEMKPFKYWKAKCHVPAASAVSKKYYFEVRTKNPYL